MKIYTAYEVSSIFNWYSNLVSPPCEEVIAAHLAAVADRHFEGLTNEHDKAYLELNNYHPQYLGKPIETLKLIEFNLEDSRQTIASEYGFKDWHEVELLGDLRYNIEFENAIDSLLTGDLVKLRGLISKNRQLLTQRSQYGHQATLLHYCASNGVEMWRQRVPLNLPEIAKYLIDQGADIDATMKVYAGDFDTLSLLTTSAHPYEAQVADKMVSILTK